MEYISFSGAGKIYLLSSDHTCHICNSRTFFLHASNAENLPANDSTQKRLNSLCILHVYGKLTDDLNIEKLI
ncbi:hypothetical protein PR048_018487 [Dryococelus australis]|uniref:Uncharacterized protein n=1 Tax=Dryococelus australis TaxID=614101 RepID=A0ABQ9HCK7_9NEOP|nr:hypothetical protein PR048_018487 [Dryococelus australis]